MEAANSLFLQHAALFDSSLDRKKEHCAGGLVHGGREALLHQVRTEYMTTFQVISLSLTLVRHVSSCGYLSEAS